MTTTCPHNTSFMNMYTPHKHMPVSHYFPPFVSHLTPRDGLHLVRVVFSLIANTYASRP